MQIADTGDIHKRSLESSQKNIKIRSGKMEPLSVYDEMTTQFTLNHETWEHNNDYSRPDTEIQKKSAKWYKL